MTPLRWNWSANNPLLDEIGLHQRPRQPDFSGFTPTRSRGRVRWPAGAGLRAVPRIVARRLAKYARGASRALHRAVGSSVTETMVEHRSLAPSPPWAGRMARVDRAARVAKGQVGAAIDVPRAMSLLFHLTAPALSAGTISKMPLKPAAPSCRRGARISPGRRQQRPTRSCCTRLPANLIAPRPH
jgi:hypothetical protein